MFERIKKYWHDPVWSKVIAGVILTAVAGLGAYFLDWWPNIRRIFTTIFEFFSSSTTVPNWLLSILVIPFVLVLIIFGLLIWNKFHPRQRILSWHSYTTDTFFNIHWMWRYDDKGKIFDLYSFCPHCDFQIYAQPQYNIFREFTHIRFHCENCGHDFGGFSEMIEHFENKVIRHIQRKIRNGSWITNRAN